MSAPYTVAQLAEFAREHVASQDIDPAYPVLRHLLIEEHGAADSEEALRRTFGYLAYYNLASSETGWPRYAGDALRLPTATERRGLRGGAPMQRHLASLASIAEAAGGLHAWLTADLTNPSGPDFPGDPDLLDEMIGERNWNTLGPRLGEVWGNGRWALYKAREVLWKVNGLHLRAPDTGMANSTGPRDGLALVYPLAETFTGNTPYAIDALEDLAWDLQGELASEHGLTLGIEQVETVLCDFKAMAHGRFYVGHDIDHMQEQLYHPSVSEEARERILEARAATLPAAYLGELHGRRGVDKARCRAFAESGVILARG